MPGKQRSGFDRTIVAEWLEAALARVMTGETSDACENPSGRFFKALSLARPTIAAAERR
jgi:hypothetical protein